MTLPNYLYEAGPAAGQSVQVLPGLFWVQMPLPFALDHVNVWLLEHDGRQTIIDTGIDNSTLRGHWQTLLSRPESQPDTLLITHYHPDHCGLAGWLQQQCQCRTVFSSLEFAQATRARGASDSEFGEGQSQWYRQHGMAVDLATELGAAGNTYKPLVHDLPEQPLLLSQGDCFESGTASNGSLAQWQVITAAGHSPEMICLYNEDLNVLIAGDQVLPAITPNVSVSWYMPDENPLQSFFSSFEQFAHLPDDVMVLPSHGLPFRGLHARLQAVRDHHDERFDRILDACRQPQTAFGLLPVLFKRELDRQQLFFAMGESIAHLRYLSRAGQLAVEKTDGVEFYSLA